MGSEPATDGDSYFGQSRTFQRLQLLICRARLHYLSPERQCSGNGGALHGLVFQRMQEMSLKETKRSCFSLQANYTNRATAASLRSQCPILRIESIAWSAQRIPTTVNLDFLDPVPLHMHSSSYSFIINRLNGPRSRPTTTSHKIW
jgi:hypothetical protein